MDTRSSSEKHRFIGLMLSGGRSPHTAICALDHFQGQGRLFLVESFVGKKEKAPHDLDDALVERLGNLMQELDEPSEQVRVMTNAPLGLPPCFKCQVPKCPGKDSCEVPETIRIMELYDELKQRKKNLKKFTPYTQRLQDVWIRDAVPEVMPPHETMGSNMAQVASRMLHIRKMMPGTLFMETYPSAVMFRLLPSLGLSSSYAKDYRDVVSGRRIRASVIKKLESRASVFIYDSDMEALVDSVHLFDSLLLAFTGVLHFLGQTEGIANDYVVPVVDVKF